MWPLGGAWLCRHLWEHYLYSCDEHFLVQRAWPLMRESAEFFLDWLVEDAQGFLTTAPSTSPENSFLLPDGNRGSVCRGSAMDLSIIRELFTHCLEAVRILRLQGDSVADGIRSALPRLAPLRIGAQGQVMEWNEDWPEGEHPHRHLSQLFGLFPGAEMTPERSPHLAAAARRSLELRGDGGTGWSLAWKISLRARLGEGDRAHRLLKRLLVPVAHDVRETANDGGGVYPNLLAACPPFQIDANFGSTAGMAEMLLQSHEDNENGTVVHLLPALPAAWPEGSIHGLCARGGIHVRMEWENGALTAAVLTSTVSGQVTVRYQDRCVQFALDAGTVIRLDGALNKLSA
jgi:alpha-L-fucosidase 2